MPNVIAKISDVPILVDRSDGLSSEDVGTDVADIARLVDNIFDDVSKLVAEGERLTPPVCAPAVDTLQLDKGVSDWETGGTLLVVLSLERSSAISLGLGADGSVPEGFMLGLPRADFALGMNVLQSVMIKVAIVVAVNLEVVRLGPSSARLALSKVLMVRMVRVAAVVVADIVEVLSAALAKPVVVMFTVLVAVIRVVLCGGISLGGGFVSLKPGASVEERLVVFEGENVVVAVPETIVRLNTSGVTELVTGISVG